MTVRGIAACAALGVAMMVAPAACAQARELTLEEALRRAAELNPDIRAAEADVAAARGQLREARLLTYNPEVTGGAGRVREADSSITSYEIGVQQRFELGGKRGSRIRAAEQRLASAEARLARRREEAAAAVYRAFVLGTIARERLATGREAEQVAVQLKGAADERLALGAGTQLEVNVASAAASRERRNRLDAERGYATAVYDLAAAIGLRADEAAEPSGAPVLPPAETRAESELVALALARRADLAAATADRTAAEADLRFARGLAWPDLALGVIGGRDDLGFVRFALSVPLPLWNRGQGARAEARGALDRARVVEEAVRRRVALDVRNAHQGYVRAREAQAGFDREAVERLGENLQLVEASFRAGKIGLLVFNTVRRDLVEARLSYLDAAAEVVDRWAALQLAIGGAAEPAEKGGR